MRAQTLSTLALLVPLTLAGFLRATGGLANRRRR